MSDNIVPLHPKPAGFEIKVTLRRVGPLIGGRWEFSFPPMAMSDSLWDEMVLALQQMVADGRAD